MIDEAKVLKAWKSYTRKTCPDCGQTFVPNSARHTRCDACAKKRIKAQQAEYYARLKADKLSKIRAKCDRINAAKAEADALAEGKAHECPFCGKITKKAYCTYCHREGFDNVHMMFGITNGWDRRKKQNKIVPGWRGRAVIGVNSAACKNNS